MQGLHPSFICSTKRLVLRKRKPTLFVESENGTQQEADASPLVTDHLAAADLRKLILQLPEGYREFLTFML